MRQVTRAIWVVDDQGQVVFEGSVATDPYMIAAALAGHAPDLVGLEAGPDLAAAWPISCGWGGSGRCTWRRLLLGSGAFFLVPVTAWSGGCAISIEPWNWLMRLKVRLVGVPPCVVPKRVSPWAMALMPRAIATPSKAGADMTEWPPAWPELLRHPAQRRGSSRPASALHLDLMMNHAETSSRRPSLSERCEWGAVVAARMRAQLLKVAARGGGGDAVAAFVANLISGDVWPSTFQELERLTPRAFHGVAQSAESLRPRTVEHQVTCPLLICFS
jgi:hypothetical protein